jgi:hypothetical protein
VYLRLLRHTVERALSDYMSGTSQGRRQLGDGSIFMASGLPAKGHGALLKKSLSDRSVVRNTQEPRPKHYKTVRSNP